MSFDLAAYRRDMLQHCLWMARLDPVYAEWAAKQYEAKSHGALSGLRARVESDIASGRVKAAKEGAK